MKFMIFGLSFLALTSCATFSSTPPNRIEKLPIVQIGQEVAEGSEFILFFPAGEDIPLSLATGGSLFAQQANLQTTVTLSKDLYLFQVWASFDGKSWKRSHDLLKVSFTGGFDKSGLQAKIDLRVN